MNAAVRRYLYGITLCAATCSALAGPISVIGDSGKRGEVVTVSLRDSQTDFLDSPFVLIGFNPLHLRYLSTSVPAVQLPGPPALPGLLPLGTVLSQALVQQDASLPPPDDFLITDLTGAFPSSQNPLGAPDFIGIMVAISSNGQPSNAEDGLILGANFEILNTAPIGITSVDFRCVPLPTFSAPNTVNRNTPENTLPGICADYIIPYVEGDVNVLALTNGQVPIAGTEWLVLLGLGLMGWSLQRKRAQASH